MALADILTKIKSEAEAEARVIRERAEYEAHTLQEHAALEREKFRTASRQASVAAAEATASRVVSSAEHKARLSREAKRTEVLHAVFAEAKSLLEKLPADEYAAMIVSYAESLRSLEGVLTVAEERADETKTALKKAGLKGEIIVAPRGTLLGGFILETTDALFDYSFRTLLARAEEGSTTTLAQSLFGK